MKLKNVQKFFDPAQKKKFEKKFPFEIPGNGEKIEGKKIEGGGPKMNRGPSPTPQKKKLKKKFLFEIPCNGEKIEKKKIWGGGGGKNFFCPPPPKKIWKKNFPSKSHAMAKKLKGKKSRGGGSKMYERPSLKWWYFRFGLSHQKSKNIGWTLVKRRKFWATTRTHFYASFWVKKWKKDFKSILST